MKGGDPRVNVLGNTVLLVHPLRSSVQFTGVLTGLLLFWGKGRAGLLIVLKINKNSIISF